MRFKHLGAVLSFSICLMAAELGAGEAAKCGGETLLPDTTLVLVQIPDLSRARAAWGTTRAAEMFAQPEMQGFLKPILEQMQKTYAELRAQEPMIPALADLEKGIFSGELTAGFFVRPDAQPRGILLSIRPQDPAAFANSLKPLFRGQAPPENTPIPFGLGPEAPGMLWTQGHFVLCKPVSMLAEAAERIKNGSVAPKGSLGANADYVAAKQTLKNALGWFYFRPAGTAELLRGLAGADAPELATEQVLSKLGIQKNSALLAGVSVANGEVLNEIFLANVDRAKGIGLLFGPQPPISAGALKIAAPDAPFVSAGSFNFSAIIPLFRSMLTQPTDIDNFQRALGQANQRLTFDLQRDLLENLGGEICAAVTPLDTAMPFSFSPGIINSITLKNAAKVEECIKKAVLLINAQPSVLGLQFQAKSIPHGGKTIYYYSGMSACISGERLLVANSLNAMRRSLDQLARNEDISGSREFQETLARLSGRPFDATNLPAGFSFVQGGDSGTGTLLATSLGLAAGTAVLGALAEAVFAQPPPENQGGDPMAEVQAFLQRPAGQTALAVFNRIDLGFWPDQGFFAKHRRAKGGVMIADASGILWRTELPPPMPGYSSGGTILPGVAVTAIAAGMVLPVLARARESARRTSSASNMNQIGKACFMYADVPANGDFPSDPVKLVHRYIDARVFKNPRFPQQEAGYIYVSGASINDPTTILLYENVPEPQAAQGRNVLLVAGVVEFMDDERFKEMLRATEATIKERKGVMKLVPIDTAKFPKRLEE